ncbi:unnamed protein product [Allacma fusca]|uniref:Phospholipid scramblase n=1 Tax=Allacma fusca TaxID=39272 RepID=A0A8J2KP19_9HEXA|nr:unnamed protein product [Allacma fusca]
MADPYYPRAPPEFDRQVSSYPKLYRPVVSNDDHHHHHGPFVPVPLSDVITEQPIQSYGSQISTGLPVTFGTSSSSRPGQASSMMSPTQIGIPLPGLEILDRIPFLKVHDLGLFSGGSICSPGYRIHNMQGDMVLRGKTDTLFCPFDSKHKSVFIKDLNEEVIFQVKFTPSICECDSEEKRCFAVFSPVYENPFGAVMFEAGQLKYSLKILNALEGETFAVQFLGSSDISIKGADGTIVAIINIQRKRGETLKYTLTFTEEISSANKALFLGCIVTLDLVSCEADCSKCICLSPFLVGCLTILGLTLFSHTATTKTSSIK